MKVRCYDYHKCGKKECPSYGSGDLKCWLKSGTHCHDRINGTFLEKMDACLECGVFKSNFTEAELEETLRLVSVQFRSITGKLGREREELKEAKKKLTEFKITSVYLLKELDKKNKEVGEEVKKRTEELRGAEERLAQAAKVAALSRFSAGIAHEINNPLGAVINYVRTVIANPELSNDNRNYLEQSLKGLFRIENVVKQILSYSGKQKLELIDVNKVLKDSIEFLRYRMKDKSIQLKLHLTDGPLNIYADQAQLQQVFMNIFKNAFDAMENSKVKELRVMTSVDGKNVVIDFNDSGKGIAKENADKVFTPFFTTKEVGDGTGLGLFISYNIIQVLKGTMEILNGDNGGATVRLTLPLPSEK